jgi:hypothetical protein
MCHLPVCDFIKTKYKNRGTGAYVEDFIDDVPGLDLTRKVSDEVGHVILENRDKS